MRQREDKAFVEVLNEIGDDDVYRLGDEQVGLFDKRKQANVKSIPHDAMHLFHQTFNREEVKTRIEK